MTEFEPDREATLFNRSAYMKQWHQDNREQRREAKKRRRQEQLAWIDGIKSAQGCAHCPENDPVCLDFHHLDGSDKQFSIAAARRSDFARERMLVEMEKCKILCANCHRKEHRRVVANAA